MVDYSDEDMSNGEAFINSDTSQRFIDYFSRMSMHSERGFILDMRAENLGLPGDMKWIRLCQQPQPYNTQIVEEFYANLVDTNNKKAEVVVRVVKVSYFEGTINMLFRLGPVEDKYQDLLLASDDVNFDVYMESLCTPNTKWVGNGR